MFRIRSVRSAGSAGRLAEGAVPIRRRIVSALIAVGVSIAAVPLAMAPAGHAAAGDPLGPVVTKNNNATAATLPGDAVTFTVTVRNPNPTDSMTITAVQDQVGSGTPFDVCSGGSSPGNEDFVQLVLAPLATTAVCSYTLQGYAPGHNTTKTNTVTVTATVTRAAGTRAAGVSYLVADEDVIDNTTPGYLDAGGNPQTFTAADVNDDSGAGEPHLGKAERTPLRFFDGALNPTNNVGAVITLRTGQDSDRGLFEISEPAISRQPDPDQSWLAVGPTADGLRNFFGEPTGPDTEPAGSAGEHQVGIGLGAPDGTGNNPEIYLDKVPSISYGATRLLDPGFVGRKLCLLVKDSDVSSTGTDEHNFQGEYLGVAGVEVLAVVDPQPAGLGAPSSSTLPAIQVRILDPVATCGSPAETTFNLSGSHSSDVFTPPAGAPPAEPPALTVTVDKTNDANGDATFNDSETAPAAGSPVQFRALVTNTSTVPVVIVSLTDVYPGQANPINVSVCEAPGFAGDPVGRVLAPDASLTCFFTVAAYSPPAGSSLVNTVAIVVHEFARPSNTATDTDISTVDSPASTGSQPEVLGNNQTESGASPGGAGGAPGTTVAPGGTAAPGTTQPPLVGGGDLPRTGSSSVRQLLMIGAFAVALGGVSMLLGRRPGKVTAGEAR